MLRSLIARQDSSSGMAFLAVLVAGMALAAFGSTIAPVPPKPDHSGNRYLLLLDTSRGMARCSEALFNSVGELVYTGMNGQMRPGDTLGIWTFDTSLQRGVFPLQGWASGKASAERVTKNVLHFVKQLKFEKKASFEAVMPELNEVIRDSRVLTVIIFSDGKSKISGTPFDQKINENYAAWAEEQQRARRPIITALVALDGKLTNFVVVPVPWTLNLPAVPAPPPIAKVATPVPTNVPPVGKPLIVVGKKPSPAIPEPTPIVPSNLASNTQAQAVPPIASPGATARPPSEAEPKPAQSLQPPTGKPVGEIVTATNKSVEIPQGVLPTTSGFPAAVTAAAGTSATAIEATVEPPKPAPKLESGPGTAPVVQRSATELVQNRLLTGVSNSESIGSGPTGAEPVAVGTVTAVPTRPAPPGTSRIFLILVALGGLAVVVLAFWILLMARQRSRRHEPISLITRSLDRNKDL